MEFINKVKNASEIDVQVYELSKQISTNRWKIDVLFEESSFKFRFKERDYEFLLSNPNFIHDFTGFREAYFSDMMIDGMTPDYYDSEILFEFATKEVMSTEILMNAFHKKMKKYSHIIDKYGLSGRIMVVGMRKIVCNFELSEEDVDNMIRHYNAALKIRDIVADKLGRDLWTSNDESKVSRILNNVLISHVPIKQVGDFELSLNDDLPVFNINDTNDFLKELSSQVKAIKIDLKTDHCKNHFVYGTREDKKRCVPYPMITPKSTKNKVRTKLIYPFPNDFEGDDIREYIVSQAFDKGVTIIHDEDKEMKIAMEEELEPKERTKLMYQFKVKLDDDQRISLATTGVQAKLLVNESQVRDKRIRDKESFSESAPTDDINDFINMSSLSEALLGKDIAEISFQDWALSYVDNEIKNADYSYKDVMKDYQEIKNTKIIKFCKFINALGVELNLSIRDALNKDYFIVKPIPGYKADVYIKVIGSNKPIFFFVVGKIDENFGPASLGVKYTTYNKGKFFVSEFSSVRIRDLELIISLYSKMISSISYLKQLRFQSVSTLNQHVNLILLLALSNKDRDEELVTLLRYVYMRSISWTDNVTTLVNKLPTVYRSRLTVFLVQKVKNLMSYLHVHKPKVIKTNQGADRDVGGLIDIFHNEINFKQALNMFYYGYIVNKQKQTESNQATKLIDKILEYDLKVEDGKKLSGVDLNDDIQDHYHSKKYMSAILFFAKSIVTESYGENYQERLDYQIARKFSKMNMMTLSTIKASAKYNLPDFYSEENMRIIKGKRPKVTESLKKLTNDFGKSFEHPIELINYCIYEIDRNDCFNVELFSKDQHAGIREIYVVDIRVRIIQWFLETISRSLCELFESETMTNPKMKDSISQRMTRKSISQFNDPMVLCRSGDASKWSQTQNVTKFYQCLKYFLPKKYHNIIKSILTLWFRKKIYIPASIVEFCLSSKDILTNPSINFIRDIYTGVREDPRLNPKQLFLRIRTGFMQGILHFTSSFFHTIVQEAFKLIKDLLTMKVSKRHVEGRRVFFNIILQGSDDNSEIIIVDKNEFKKNKNFFIAMVQIKDICSKFLGIKVSEEKTASCVPFLMEYNSTWEIAGKFLMPTIKFIFSSMDIPSKQTMVGRQEYFYALLTNCLEKGATIRTLNVVRMAQCYLHYSLLGYNYNSLFNPYYSKIKEVMSPSLGYFMFEPILVTSIIGFDFMLYWHSLNTKFRNYLDLDGKIIPDGVLNKAGYRSLADYTISKMDYKNWKRIIENLDMCSVEESREVLNERPEQLYATVHDPDFEWHFINVKMHDFSVKEAVSSRFHKSEMAASGVYILSRKVCHFNKEKHSLIYLSENEKFKARTEEEIREAFPRSKQYDEKILEIKNIEKCNVIRDTEYVQRGSTRIEILEGINDEGYKLIELCKHQWFGIKNLALNSEMYKLFFDKAKEKLPWLRDTEKETKEVISIDSSGLYLYLLNCFKDSRSITLMDNPGKRGTLKYVISRMIDVNKKLTYMPLIKEEIQTNLKTIKSNIKFLAEFPLDVVNKNTIMRNLIKEILKEDLKRDERMKYEIFNKVLDRKSPIENLILNQKNLDFLIFIKPQIFNKKTKKWQGEGVVMAQKQGFLFEIHMEDREALSICVKDLSEAKKNYTIILKTMSELDLNIPQRQQLITLMLNKSGISRSTIGVPISQDPSMLIDLTKLRNLEFIIEKNRLKIITTCLSSDLIKSNLSKRLAFVELVKIINDFGEEIWILPQQINKFKNKKICGRHTFSHDMATMSSTILSLNISSYIHNPNLKNMIKNSPIINFFWNNQTNLYKLAFALINDVSVERPLIEWLNKTIDHNRLDSNYQNTFYNMVNYKEISIDEFEEEMDEGEPLMSQNEMVKFYNSIDGEFTLDEALVNMEVEINEGDFEEYEDILNYETKKEGKTKVNLYNSCLNPTLMKTLISEVEKSISKGKTFIDVLNGEELENVDRTCLIVIVFLFNTRSEEFINEWIKVSNMNLRNLECKIDNEDEMILHLCNNFGIDFNPEKLELVNNIVLQHISETEKLLEVERSLYDQLSFTYKKHQKLYNIRNCELDLTRLEQLLNMLQNKMKKKSESSSQLAIIEQDLPKPQSEKPIKVYERKKISPKDKKTDEIGEIVDEKQMEMISIKPPETVNSEPERVMTRLEMEIALRKAVGMSFEDLLINNIYEIKGSPREIDKHQDLIIDESITSKPGQIENQEIVVIPDDKIKESIKDKNDMFEEIELLLYEQKKPNKTLSKQSFESKFQFSNQIEEQLETRNLVKIEVLGNNDCFWSSCLISIASIEDKRNKCWNIYDPNGYREARLTIAKKHERLGKNKEHIFEILEEGWATNMCCLDAMCSLFKVNVNYFHQQDVGLFIVNKFNSNKKDKWKESFNIYYNGSDHFNALVEKNRLGEWLREFNEVILKIELPFGFNLKIFDPPDSSSEEEE